jgi:hypothetical protein
MPYALVTEELAHLDPNHSGSELIPGAIHLSFAHKLILLSRRETWGPDAPVKLDPWSSGPSFFIEQDGLLMIGGGCERGERVCWDTDREELAREELSPFRFHCRRGRDKQSAKEGER